MRKLIITAALTLATLTGFGAGAATMAGATPESHTSPVITWISNRPCAAEDSTNCAWNAQEQGNRHGHSFIVRTFPGRAHLTCWMYDERRFARTHDYCIRNR